MARSAVLVACFLLAIACNKKSGPDSGNSRQSDPRKTSSPLSLDKPNTLQWLTYIRDKDRKWVRSQGDTRMKTAVITKFGGYVMLVFSDSDVGCQVFSRAQLGKVRISVGLRNLSAEQKSGTAALKGTAIRANMAVVYTGGFNAMFLTMGTKINRIEFLSGALKPGTVASGRIDLNDRSPAPFRKGMYSLLHGNFHADVCKSVAK